MSVKVTLDKKDEQIAQLEAEVERLDRHSDEIYKHYVTATEEREEQKARAEKAEADLRFKIEQMHEVESELGYHKRRAEKAEACAAELQSDARYYSQESDDWKARAEKAEAEIERLTNECGIWAERAVDLGFWKARAEKAEATKYVTKYKNAKRRADEAEARAERYAGVIRGVEEWDGEGDERWCNFCCRWGNEKHAPDCIKAEVERGEGKK